MELKYIILLIIAVIYWLLGALIIKRYRNSRGGLYFGFLCLLGGCWAALMSLLYSLANLLVLDIIVRGMVLTSTLMFWLYLLFAINYPYPYAIKKVWLFSIAPIILVVLSIIGIIPVEKVYFANGGLVEQVIFGNYLIYGIYYTVYLFLTFYILIIKFLSSGGVIRVQLKYISIASGVTFIIMFFFSVILPLINHYFHDWFSPIFLLINFFILNYFIYFKKYN